TPYKVGKQRNSYSLAVDEEFFILPICYKGSSCFLASLGLLLLENRQTSTLITFCKLHSGEADFTFGNVTGLDHVRRKGDCSGPKNFKGEITINCTLSVYPVVTSYRVVLRNGSNVYFLRNQGHVAETLVHIEIAGRPQNYVGSVKNYRVDRLGLITPTFSQLPPALNKYLHVLQNAYRAHVSTELFNIFQQRYVYAFGRAFAYKPMPRQ
ncbi:uncharacterized protein TNCT_300641, partial [Trichonephila clavata]